ncbi:MAG: hypothetical protein AAB471_01965 [Patescibacteria group bacterium]
MKNTNGKIFTFQGLFFGLVIASALILSAPLAQAQSVSQNVSGVTCSSAILNGWVTPNGNLTEAWFEYGPTSFFGNTTIRQNFPSSSAYATFSRLISGLNANTTYYWRAMAQNSAGAAQGTLQSFTTSSCGGSSSQPTVNTNTPSNINQNGATLSGTVNGNGANTNAWFEWGPTSSFGNTVPQSSYGTGFSNYSYTLSNLNYNTTYYYRALAQNSQGIIVYGNVVSFSTGFDNYNCSNYGYYGNCGNTNQPYVTTYGATGVGDTFAYLNGQVDPNGVNTTRWFEWGTNNNYLGSQTIKTGQGLSTGSFNQLITGLVPNATYYYRAVAQGPSGQVYGNILTFNTTGLGGVSGSSGISATTLLATNVGQTSARLNALALTNQNYNYSYNNSNYYLSLSYASPSGYFEWGTDSSLGITNTTPSQTIGTAPSVSFFASLFGLQPNTRYYYRAVVTNSQGTFKGDIMNFTTGTNVTRDNSPTVIVKNTTTVPTGTAKPSLMGLSIDRSGVCAPRGENIEYVVTYKNTSARALKDVVLRVILPAELSFKDTNRGTYSDKDNSVVVSIGAVAAGEEGTVRVRADVGRTAETGKTIVITAALVDTDSGSGAQEEVVAYSLNNICAGTGVTQAAASFFGGDGFFPSTFLGWLLLVLVILGLILVSRKFYNNKTIQ